MINSKMKNKKVKGFTLIELLAIILILSIVVTIGVISVNGINKKSREKSYKTTINNVQEIVNSYLAENANKLFFLNKDKIESTYEYQCVTIKNLIDYGYFTNDLLNKKVSDNKKILESDFIYFEREKSTKAINKINYILDDEDGKITTCTDAIKAEGDIWFNVDKAGWATSKIVTINYKIKSINDYSQIGNYVGTYSFDNSSSNNEYFNDYTLIKTTDSIIKDGKIRASIKIDDEIIAEKEFDVDKIDREAPIVNMVSNISNKVINSSESVYVEFNIEDLKSGVDIYSIKNNAFVLYVKNNQTNDITTIYDCHSIYIENGKFYIKINNVKVPGSLSVGIVKDGIKDAVGNGVDKLSFETGITVVNTYKISYNANGGTGTVNDTTCYYGEICYLNDNSFTYAGHKFSCWYLNNSCVGTSNNSGYYIKYDAGEVVNNVLTLKANWNVNKVYIIYNTNGGSLIDPHGSNYSINNGNIVNSSITNRDKTYLEAISYGGSLGSSGLYNVNNSSYVNLGKNGYSIVSGSEWCKSDGTTCFNQTDSYEASKFCDALLDNCNVTLYAHWKLNAYTLNISQGSNSTITVSRTSSPNGNGSIGTLSSGATIYYGDVLSISASASTGYSIGSLKVTGGSGSASSYTVGVSNVSVTSVATPNTYKIYFAMNGGTPQISAIDRTYGQSFNFPSTTPTKTGYTFGGWVWAQSGKNLAFTSTATSGNYAAGAAGGTCSSCIVYTASDATYVATWSVSEYTLNISQGSNSTITVSRTSSPKGNGSIGTLSSGTTIYYGDVLTISFGVSSGYDLSTHTVNSSSFTSDESYTVEGNVDVISSATEKPADINNSCYSYKAWSCSTTGSGYRYSSDGSFYCTSGSFALYFTGPQCSYKKANYNSDGKFTGYSTLYYYSYNTKYSICDSIISGLCGNTTMVSTVSGYTSCVSGNYTYYYQQSKTGSCYDEGSLISYYTYTYSSKKSLSSSSSSSSSRTGGGCFLADTKVLTDNGYKNISDIKTGDKVLSYNEDNNINEYKDVVNLIVHDNIKSYLYNLKINGNDFLVTEAHVIYVKRGFKTMWIRVDKTKVGDMLMDKDGNWYPIMGISYKVIDDVVYNLEIIDNHTYYVGENNILVHNAKSKD